MTVPLPVLLVVAATLGASALVAGLVVFAFARALTAAQHRQAEAEATRATALRLLHELQQAREAELHSFAAQVDALQRSYSRMVEKYGLEDAARPPIRH